MITLLKKIKNLDFGTKIRSLLQILVYINQFIAVIGMSSFATYHVYQWISFVLTLVVTLVSYWYNNNWTGAAQLAGDILKMLKDGKITQNEVADFLEKHKKEHEKDNE